MKNRLKLAGPRGFHLSLCLMMLVSCVQEEQGHLKIYGERVFNGSDTIYHTIENFRFVNQDSAIVTNETFDEKIYVTDFFFTSCRTICPVMKTQMLRVYNEIRDDSEVMLLSHTIDPRHDTVALLRDFAERLGVSSSKWHFVTGDQDSIYDMAQKSYFVTALEDQAEPDGFIHSGAFMLIDKERRVRGAYDGTSEESVSRLLDDIERLKEEYHDASQRSGNQ